MLFQTNLYTDPYMTNTAATGAAAGLGMGMSLFLLSAFYIACSRISKSLSKGWS